MRTFPVLMKSMNDRVRPSDELLEDTKAKMRAAIQAKEAPIKKAPVFRYSTALAGLALVIAGATFLPHSTDNLSGLPYSGNDVSSKSPDSGFSTESPLGEEESRGSNDSSGSQTKPNPAKPNTVPPKATVQPPLYPALPPESAGKDSENQPQPNILAPNGSLDSKFQYPSLFYSKRLPTLSEIGVASEDGSTSSSAPIDDKPSVPSSPIDAPIQNPSSEPPSGANGALGANHETPDASGTPSNAAEPSVPSLNELTDDTTASVVSVGDNTLYFQPISSMTVSSWTITDPENVEEKQWTTEEAISYFGRDPQNFSLPQGMKLTSSDTYSVWLDKEGTPYYDSVGFEFTNGSSTLTITMSKMGIPKYRSITMLNRQGSVLNGVSMQIGCKSVEGQKDTYTAEFVSGGIGYQIISGNLSQREFITLIQSITS